MAALKFVQCEILKQYLIDTTYSTEFLCGGEAVQVTMSVYSQFLGKINVLPTVQVFWLNDVYLLIIVTRCMKLSSCHILPINEGLGRLVFN